MSPEQATADPSLDARSDQYSLAIVIFELIAGTHPFGGLRPHETISRRLTAPAPRLREHAPTVAASIDRVVARAMALDAAHRYASVAEFITDLRAARDGEGGPRAVETSAPASLAVLPFVNLSRDEDSEYFSDGVTEEIITALSRLRNLKVASRSSAFAFKGQRQDVRRIAAALGVRTVLEGSVRLAGNRVRVSAQLVEAESGFQLWSDRFDRDVTDIFAIQEDIGQAIVSVLQVHLLGVAAGPLADPGTTNPVAHDLYLRARFNLNRRVESALREAVTQLRESLAFDPAFVLAHAALAEGNLLLGLYGAEAPRTVFPEARASIETALALDPALADGQATLGSLAALMEWDWTRAEASFRRAITLGPRSPSVRHRYAMDCLLPQRRFQDALRELDEACQLDPLSLIMQASRGVVMHLAGDLAGARDLLHQMRRTHPAFVMAPYFLGAVLRDAGDLEASQQAFEEAIALGGETPEMTAGLAQTLALRGRRDEAMAHLGRLTELARSRFVSPALRGQVLLAVGDLEPALELLEAAAELRDPEVLHLSTRGIYARVAGTDRFARLRSSIGVPVRA